MVIPGATEESGVEAGRRQRQRVGIDELSHSGYPSLLLQHTLYLS